MTFRKIPKILLLISLTFISFAFAENQIKEDIENFLTKVDEQLEESKRQNFDLVRMQKGISVLVDSANWEQVKSYIERLNYLIPADSALRKELVLLNEKIDELIAFEKAKVEAEFKKSVSVIFDYLESSLESKELNNVEIEKILLELKGKNQSNRELRTHLSEINGITEYWKQSYAQMTNNQFYEARNGIPRIRSRVNSPIILERVSPLLEKFESLLKELELAYMAKVEDEVRSLKSDLETLLLEATVVKDLDAMIFRLSSVEESMNGQSTLNDTKRKIGQWSRLVQTWQEYLLALNKGDYNATRSKLNSVKSYNDQQPLIARSYILKMKLPNSKESNYESEMEAKQQFELFISKAEEIDDIAQLSDYLYEYRVLADKYSLIRRIEHSFVMSIHQLGSISKSYYYYTVGDLSKAVEFYRNGYPYLKGDELPNLPKILRSQALNLLKKFHDIEVPKAVLPDEYLDLIVADLSQKKDWLRLWELFMIGEPISNGFKNKYSGLRNSIELYNNALGFIDAEEYGFAWEELIKANMGLRNEVLQKEIVSTMKRLKKDHSEQLQAQLNKPLVMKREPSTIPIRPSHPYSRMRDAREVAELLRQPEMEKVIDTKLSEKIDIKIMTLKNLSEQSEKKKQATAEQE